MDQGRSGQPDDHCDKCELLLEELAGRDDRTYSMSPLSPGPVEDHETLARLIFTPIHTEEDTGKVTPAAFSDVVDKGLSVDRLNHASPEEVLERGRRKEQQDRARGKERTFVGVVTAVCENIRRVEHEDRRAFVVFDTAEEDNVSHADVCQNNDVGSKSQQKKLRRRLQQLFSRSPSMTF